MMLSLPILQTQAPTPTNLKKPSYPPISSTLKQNSEIQNPDPKPQPHPKPLNIQNVPFYA